MKLTSVAERLAFALLVMTLLSSWSKVSFAEYPYCSKFVIVNYLPNAYVESSLATALRDALKRNIEFKDEIEIVNEARPSTLPRTLERVKQGKDAHVVVASVEMLSARATDMLVLDHPSLPDIFAKKGIDVYSSLLGQSLNAYLASKQGAYFLGASWFPTYMVAKQTGFQKLADVKGLKIRSASNTMRLVANALGIAAVSLPAANVYTAIERGVIDGTILPVLLAKRITPNLQLVSLSGRRSFLPQGVAMIVSKTLLDKGPREVIKPLLLSGYEASFVSFQSWSDSAKDVLGQHPGKSVSLGPAEDIRRVFENKVTPTLFKVYDQRKISSATIDALRALIEESGK